MLESVESVRRTVDLGGGRTLTASSLVERMGFRAERAWTRVGELSGGERRRLQLVRLLMDEPNVLLLDEPSNDLDIETLTALEDLLDGFAGTVVLVSHDRYVLERVCDRVVGLLGDGRLRDLPGGVEEYLALRAAQDEATPRGPCPSRSRPRDRRPATYGLRARSSRASSGASTGSGPRRYGCTTRSRRRPATTSASSPSTPSCAACSPSGRDLEEEWLGLAERLEGSVP